ncbi:hypothetical protein ACHAWF_009779 [Thalassiosira exigua]
MPSLLSHHQSLCDPEYIAIIIAATQGARLFPLTSEYPHGVPKHLLPISPLNLPACGDGADGGGCPLLQRLLVQTYENGFEMVVVAINSEDSLTVPFLLGRGKNDGDSATTTGLCKMLSKEGWSSVAVAAGENAVTDLEFLGHCSETLASSKKNDKAQPPARRRMHVRVVRLPEDCNGSADALRFLSDHGNNNSASPTKGETADGKHESNGGFIPPTSHAVVMPGDLIIEGSLLSQTDGDRTKDYDGENVLSLLVQAHRRWNAGGPQSLTVAACTILLTNLGADDKEGVPLKESSKAKMGLISRAEEEMEYIGISSEIPPPLDRHLNWNKTKGQGRTKTHHTKEIFVLSGGKSHREKSIGSTGGMGWISICSTATVDHSPTIQLRTDLHDIHVYVISNWVFNLIQADHWQSFQKGSIRSHVVEGGGK